MHIFKTAISLVIHKTKRVCSTVEGGNTNLARCGAFWLSITTSAVRSKSLFVKATVHGTPFVWTVHVPSRVKKNLVMAKISITCATYHACFEFLHNCPQHDSSSCIGGIFCNGYVDGFWEYDLFTVFFKTFNGKSSGFSVFEMGRKKSCLCESKKISF